VASRIPSDNKWFRMSVVIAECVRRSRFYRIRTTSSFEIRLNRSDCTVEEPERNESKHAKGAQFQSHVATLENLLTLWYQLW